jgi:hypothetical protein
MGKGFKIYAITFFALTAALIILDVIGSHGIDLLPVFALLWATANVFLVRYASSVKRFAGILFAFIVFDAWVDGYAHGDTYHNLMPEGPSAWIKTPFILGWDFVMYPYSHPLTIVYLIILWGILNPLQFYALTYYFVDLYTTKNVNKLFTPQTKTQNILLILIADLYLVSFSLSDYFNFLLRGYFPMVGLFPDVPWAYEVSFLHLIIMVSMALVIFILIFTVKLGRAGSRAKSFGYILVLFIIFLVMRIGIPYFYCMFTESIEISAAFIVGLIILLGVVAIGFAAGIYYIGRMRTYRGTIVRL